MSALLHLLGGGLLLYFGAKWLVAGSSALALALRIPQLIVGYLASKIALRRGAA